MQPIKKTYIFLVSTINENNEKCHSLPIEATSQLNALHNYKRYRSDDKTLNATASIIQCNDLPITTLRNLPNASNFHIVDRNKKTFDYKFFSFPTVLKKLGFSNSTYTYECVDEDGNKYFLDGSIWCISKECDKNYENNVFDL